MIKRIALLLLVLMTLSVPVMAAEPENGVIEGRLLNGTSDLTVPNQEVTLKTYLNDAEVSLDTTETDAEGGFVFSGLSTASNYSYNISIIFQEAEYGDEWVVFAQGETTKSVEITVYDATISDEGIEVELSHTIIYVDNDGLLVKEFYHFSNNTNMTYIGFKPNADSETRQTLKFYLPDNASGFQPDGELMSCCIYASDNGFVDSMPVFPGVREIAYSYKVNYDAGEYLLSRTVDYPIGDYNLLVQGEGVVVDSGQLIRGEPLSMGDTVYSYFLGGSMEPGETLTAAISSLPEISSQNTTTWVMLAAVVMVVGAVSGYLFSKKERPQPVRQEANLGRKGQQPQPAAQGTNFSRKRQRLLVELARLDDDFEAGKIAEDNYRRQRQDVKARLIELMPR